MPPPALWMGKCVEAQGCDPDQCDRFCGDCPWEEYEVVDEKATASGCVCKVKFPDGTVVDDIHSRFLRLKKTTKRQRTDAA